MYFSRLIYRWWLALPALFLTLPLHGAGQFDPAFGSNGRQVIGFNEVFDFNDGAVAIGTQSDGRLILVGSVRTESTTLSTGLTRLTRGGQIDTSFGSFGRRVIRDSAGQYLFPVAAAIQSDDKIVITGSRYPSPPVRTGDGEGIIGTIEWFVLRVLANGSGLDPSFGNGGIVLLDFGRQLETAGAIAIQGDGRIVLAGTVDGTLVDPRMVAARLTSNGALDSSFGGGDGLFDEVFASTYSYSRGYAVLIQSDGKIVVGGLARKNSAPGDDDMAVLRLESNGLADSGFGTLPQAGRVVVDFSITGLTRDDAVHALAYRRPFLVSASRRLILGGYERSGSGPQEVAMAMLTYEGALDTGFSGNGKLELGTGFGSSATRINALALERLSPLLLETADHILLAGSAATSATRNSCFAARVDFSGTFDLDFAGGSFLLFNMSGSSVNDECRAGLESAGNLYLAGQTRQNMTMTGDDFSAFALTAADALFRNGFE